MIINSLKAKKPLIFVAINGFFTRSFFKKCCRITLIAKIPPLNKADFSTFETKAKPNKRSDVFLRAA